MDVYVEAGTKWVFAGALDWPGLCRRGRDEAESLEGLAGHADRYLGVLPGDLVGGFRLDGFEVVERLAGDKTTDWGAPGRIPSHDRRDVGAEEIRRLTHILTACWEAFDSTAASAGELRKGPRGGGRDAAKMTEHVNEADRAYLAKLGAGYRSDEALEPAADLARMREAFVAAVVAAAAGEPPAKMPRSGPAGLWPPAYAVRRSAWHALDHLWEIEDRS